MTTAEERQEILGLVASGKISAAEAADLLAAASKGAAGVSPEEPVKANSIEIEEVVTDPAAAVTGKKASWLHVRVSDLGTGKRKVTVNIPLRLMKLGLRLGGAFAPELQEIDVDELSRSLESDGRGILVDVEDEEDGNHVQIYVD
jgi:hypothetical protein